MKQIVYTASILASVLLVNCGPKMTESGSHSGENVALTDVDPMPFAESISPEELKEMLYVYGYTDVPSACKSVHTCPSAHADIYTNRQMSKHT